MANFKGFKQALLSQYSAATEDERKGYIWFVRETSGETTTSAAVYFGNRKYAEINADGKEANIIASLGDMVDENGNWLGFLPTAGHEIISEAADATDAFEKLEAAIIAVKARMTSAETRITSAETRIEATETAIAGKADASTVTALAARVTSAETDIDALEVRAQSAETRMDEIERVTASGLTSLNTRMASAESAITALTAEVDTKAEQSDLDALEARVAEAEGDITALTAEVATKAAQSDLDALEARVDTAESAITALTAEVALKANVADVYTKSQVYNKEEVDGKIAGAFKFMGEASAISEDETTIYVQSGASVVEIVAAESNKGHVYQIGDKEYASNGSKWVKLGFNIDLSEYAKKTYVDSSVTAEATARQTADTNLNNAITAESATRLAKDNALESAITSEEAARIAADNALDEDIDELDSALTAEIAARESADATLDSKISAETVARESLAARVTVAEGDIDNLEERATVSAATFADADAMVSAMTHGQIIYVNADEGTESGRTAGAYIKIGDTLKKLDISSGSGDTPLERITALETKVGSTALPEGTTLTSAVAALLTVTGGDVE